MKYRRVAAACAAAALTVLTATSAYADEVYNDLPTLWGSTQLELMTLQFDVTNNIAGSADSTVLSVFADPNDGFNGGGPNAAGCNFVGNKTLTLSAQPTVAGVAVVSFLDGDNVLAGCGDQVTVVVTPVGVGDTNVVFSGTFSTGENAAMNDFDLSPAHFHVRVDDADLSNGGGEVTRCDVDPAAPAWAAAILQASGVKSNSPLFKSAIPAVAQHMDPTASFDGVAKDNQFSDQGVDYDYANAVRDYLALLLPSKQLATVEVAKRPGWACTQVAGAAPTS